MQTTKEVKKCLLISTKRKKAKTSTMLGVVNITARTRSAFASVITQTRGSGAGKIRNSVLRLKSTPERKSTLGTTQIRNAFARQSAQRNRLRKPHKIDV